MSRDLPTSTKKLSEAKPQLKKKNACHHEGGHEEVMGYQNLRGLRALCALHVLADCDVFDCLRLAGTFGVDEVCVASPSCTRGHQWQNLTSNRQRSDHGISPPIHPKSRNFKTLANYCADGISFAVR